MTKNEYMNQLTWYLRKLPKQEYEDAVEYFTEYFNEAGPEGEQDLIRELGSPKEAARELINNLLDQKVKEEKQGGRSSVIWIAILAVCAAPIAAPLLFVLLAIGFSLLICALCCVVALFLVDLCGVIVSGKILLRGLVALPYSASGAAMLVGNGLLGIGAAILLILLTIYLCVGIRWLLIKLAQKISNRGKKTALGHTERGEESVCRKEDSHE